MTQPQQKNQRPELLAPAGDMASLKAALLAGADAVYLAGRRFGARAFAQNFDENGLRWARRVTLSLNRRLYITLNTLVFDSEWQLLDQAIDFLEVLRPDAIIVQDLGVAEHLKERGCTIPRHLSTQAAWFGVGGEKFLRDLGITRVILPRELSLAEIGALAGRTSLELEIFVHGAMCYSISGRCFWSIALGPRSGNRGTCAQPCRKPYRYLQGAVGAEMWPFSPKDLRLAERISEICKLGVASLKIEGRMRGADYVYHVVKIYRELLDKVSADLPSGQNPHVIECKNFSHEADQAHANNKHLDEFLGRSYTRSTHAGFADGPPTRDWTTGHHPGHEGVYLGHVVARRSDGLTELECCFPPRAGDGVSWELDTDNRRGARLTYVTEVPNKYKHWLVRGLPAELAIGTKLWRTSCGNAHHWSADWKKEWERTPVDLFWSGREGQPLAVETKLNGRAIRLTTNESLCIAMSGGLEAGVLAEKFNVLGEHFRARRHVMTALARGLFVPTTELKKLKRALVDALLQMERLPPPTSTNMLELHAKQAQTKSIKLEEQVIKKPEAEAENGVYKPKLYIRIWNQSFPFTRDLHPDAWILPFGEVRMPFHVDPEQVRYWLPPVLNFDHLKVLIKAMHDLPPQEFLCFGWEAFALAEACPQHRYRLDWTFNLVNRRAVECVYTQGFIPTCAREWPPKVLPLIPNVVWTAALNPVVSFSRFPCRVDSKSFLINSHKDRFFCLDVGNGVTALCLSEIPTTITPPLGCDVQIDVAVAPLDNPVELASILSDLIKPVRNCFTSGIAASNSSSCSTKK